ncbi:CYTH domain-containing protein [Myroides phaeus]|uniref:CYTH domain-containing protein n=1 Tax=Myroides phaeus TaxID=702745 RepID=UPI001303D4CE|nr:CYTH domain-containing protein [Myroides phaeus]
MAQEIEHKFLVKDSFFQDVTHSIHIVQGYLSSVPERTVRVRIKGEQAFLTIKGIGDKTGISRFEWEKEILLQEAKSLLKICEPGIIDKTRHIAKIDGFIYEIDEFHGSNQGLIVAEIEVSKIGEKFPKPNWLGEEVTGQLKYYNSMLMHHPFNTW